MYKKEYNKTVIITKDDLIVKIWDRVEWFQMSKEGELRVDYLNIVEDILGISIYSFLNKEPLTELFEWNEEYSLTVY